MEALRQWLHSRASGSGQLAKERLKVVLVHDRLDMSPAMMEELKEELVAVLSKYFDVDHASIAVDVLRTARADEVTVNIPLKSKRSSG